MADRAVRSWSGVPARLLVAATCCALLAWVWRAWRVDSTPYADALVGRTRDDEMLRVAGTFSSLGSLEGRVVLLAIVLTGLLAARRFLDGAYVVTVISSVHAAERLIKNAAERSRPPGPESGYFLPSPVRWAVLVIALIAVTIWWARRGGSWFRPVGVIALAGVLYVLGQAVGTIDIPAHASSFPSGHAANTMAIAASLLIIERGRLRTGPMISAVIVAVVLVGSVGWSRVALGYHHPTDVIAGWAFAIVIAIVVDAVRQAGSIGVRRSRGATSDELASPRGQGASLG